MQQELNGEYNEGYVHEAVDKEYEATVASPPINRMRPTATSLRSDQKGRVTLFVFLFKDARERRTEG